MLYYHVIYKVYLEGCAPDVREEWIQTTTYTTNQQVHDMLMAEHYPNVSLIRCLQISAEDYTMRRNLPHISILNQGEIDPSNLALWNMDENARMKKKLRDDDLQSNQRFGSTDRPTPLL